jgi:hypothetical protein
MRRGAGALIISRSHHNPSKGKQLDSPRLPETGLSPSSTAYIFSFSAHSGPIRETKLLMSRRRYSPDDLARIPHEHHVRNVDYYRRTPVAHPGRRLEHFSFAERPAWRWGLPSRISRLGAAGAYWSRRLPASRSNTSCSTGCAILTTRRWSITSSPASAVRGPGHPAPQASAGRSSNVRPGRGTSCRIEVKADHLTTTSASRRPRTLAGRGHRRYLI